jgi:hypothetical protein
MYITNVVILLFSLLCLQDEKKHFQMELVNRETNFNKMFNGDPKVGVMNPLVFPTHKVRLQLWSLHCISILIA